MRIFIAIPISEELQKKILEYRKFYPNLSVRWLDGKNLHITLIPPWEENDINKIKNILKTIEGKIGPIEFIFNNVSYGSNNYSPRLIWATGPTFSKIIEFKKLLETVLNPVRNKTSIVSGQFKNGISNGVKMPAKRNDFLLHSTIARFKPEDFRNFPVKKIDDKINWKGIADEFVIMQSHLSHSGADYKILERFKI